MMTITQFDMFQGDSQRAISKKPNISRVVYRPCILERNEAAEQVKDKRRSGRAKKVSATIYESHDL